eukprot:GHVQ01010743.1.p2 GENE.GHVQ01010743.1~~GHVQ01010743.1.p2  ORF type:complete len:137 (-),score=26.46 GHVQ01010743.1:2340-2750(-)
MNIRRVIASAASVCCLATDIPVAAAGSPFTKDRRQLSQRLMSAWDVLDVSDMSVREDPSSPSSILIDTKKPLSRQLMLRMGKKAVSDASYKEPHEISEGKNSRDLADLKHSVCESVFASCTVSGGLCVLYNEINCV